MKSLIAVAVLVTLSGCSTYQTHLKTGCIWSCAEWTQRLAENPNMRTSGVGSVSTAYSTVQTDQGGFAVSRIGSSVSVHRISR